MSDIAPPAVKTWDLTLAEPIEYNGGTYDTMKLREPTMGELSKALADVGPTPAEQNKMQITLVTIVTGWPRQVVERCPFTAVVAAGDWLLTGFLPPKPPGSTAI